MAENRHVLQALCGLSLVFSGAFGCSGDIASKASTRATERTDAPADGDVSASPGENSANCTAVQPINRVRILPEKGHEDALVDVRVQGSNSGPTNDFVDLATVREAPGDGTFTELTFDNGALYRYVKLYAPDGEALAVAELALYHDDEKLSGAPFATTAGDEPEAEMRAFDDDPNTSFSGTTEGGTYIGLDLAGEHIAAAPTFSPPAGNFADAPEVTLASPTPEVQIRYTVDGSEPTRTHGTLYEAPFVPEGRANIKAVAYADCLFDSPVATARYGVGADGAIGRGLKSYHLGNSLTDTINPWLEPIADSTGVDHQYARWTIPGAPISWLAAHQGEGFGTPEEARNIRPFAASFAPIDHISLQPFTNPSLNTEGAAAVQLLEPVLAASPDVQVWVYAQWPERDRAGQSAPYLKSSLATGAPWADPPWTVARAPTSWDEATLNQESYHDAFAAWLDERIPGKPVRVVPGGRGLVKLKQAIERGQVPGITNFFDEHYSDDLHLSAKGQYMVALVFYASLYAKSPEGIVTHEGTGLTPAQATVYQRLAWEAASDKD